MVINTKWEMDCYLYENKSDQNAKARAETYLMAITPELFLENYYLFKAGNYDDIKDSIYMQRPYLVLDSLINMGLFIFETQNNFFVLNLIINGNSVEFNNVKHIAQRILNDEKRK